MSVKTASSRTLDTERPAFLAALPFCVVQGSVPLLVEYEDETTVPVRYTPTPEYRTLRQKYRIRADERPGKQVVELLGLFRDQEQAFAQCLAENEDLHRRVRELEGELTSERARVQAMQVRQAKKG